ncbi:MAG: hydrogenase maturation peptidase HycI [Chloroflexi bacterium]|nr:hydrogenase maturation peptidase HycI [Chloroflexota bacterium]
MTSPSTWQASIRAKRQTISSARANRIAIVGVGSELHGDDGVGPYIAQSLKRRFADSNLLAIDGGSAPENITGALRRFEPDWVLLIDAAHLGGTAGDVQHLSIDAIQELSGSTHALSLATFAAYLMSELGCEVSLLGVQPLAMDLCEPLTEPVQRAADEVIKALLETFRAI